MDLLPESDVRDISEEELPHPESLRNANTPEEYEAALGAIRDSLRLSSNRERS